MHTPSATTRLGLIVGTVIGSLVLALLFGGSRVDTILSKVGASISGPISGPTSGSSGSGTTGSGGSVDAKPEPKPAADPGSGVVLDAARPELLVIKTGSLELEVESVAASLAAGGRIASGLGGYVSGSQQSGDGGEGAASVTYRIPAAGWDAALVAFRGLAQRVIAEQTSTEDVTGQVVDLRARIRNLQATEAALQAIMTRAATIPDVLTVQEQLTDVRGDIERATAEKTHVEGQAALSTLTVRYGLKPAPAVVAVQKGFDPGVEVDRASARLVHILERLTAAGIWFAIVWLPFLLGLIVIGALVVVPLRRRGWLDRGSAPGSAAMG